MRFLTGLSGWISKRHAGYRHSSRLCMAVLSLFLGSFSALGGALSVESKQAPPDVTVVKREPPPVAQDVVSDVAWPFEAKPGLPIVIKQLEVCIEDFSAQGASAARLVETVKGQVLKTWTAVSGIDFVGWLPCVAGSQGVRLGFHPTARPQTFGLGKKLKGITYGAVLALPGQNAWFRKCLDLVAKLPRVKNRGDLCLRIEVTHIFGHVLGLEDDRRSTAGSDCLFDPIDYPDKPAIVAASKAGGKETSPIVAPGTPPVGTDWTVMSSCPELSKMVIGEAPVSLGPSDVKALQLIYPDIAQGAEMPQVPNSGDKK